MNSQLLKLSYDQGYESVLVALGLEKKAFIGAVGKALWTGAKFLGRNFMGKPAAGAAAPKNIMGAAGKTVDALNKPITQVGASVGSGYGNKAITDATV